jgi:hypothetical protein
VADTAAISALAEGADPAATGVFQRTNGSGGGPSIPIHWLLIMLLVGGGGGSVISSRLFSNDGSEALARVVAVEGQMGEVQAAAATINQLEGEVDRLEADQASTARMLREQNRTLLWIVDSMQKQSAAIAALAEAQGVKVDLSSPPLLPVVDPRP